MHPRLILASSSPYRQQLLRRLHLPFEVIPAQLDERRADGESAHRMAQRLAEEKALTVAARLATEARANGPTLVIGSDQTVELDTEVLGKPGSHEAAVDQLSRFAGREVLFHTGLCLLPAPADTGRRWNACETVRVRFRSLDRDAIEAYLVQERPYGCAGAFQAEGFGITLVDAIESRDPTALVGLPLVRLCGMLRAAGLSLP